MTVVLPYFPRALLRPRTLKWEIAARTVSPGQTLSGIKRIGRLDGGGYWVAQLDSVALNSFALEQAWRALAGIADGGAQAIVVPMLEKRYAPWPLSGGSQVTAYSPVYHTGSVPFAGGAGYRAAVIDARVACEAPLRATGLTIALTYGGALQGGEHFSIDDAQLRWRAYRIVTAVANPDGTYTVSIRPPLRAAAHAGAALDFDEPKCVMQLAAPDGMDVERLLAVPGDPSAAFEESFPPFS